MLKAILTVLHGLASAAWLGSMFYSLAVVQPRARAYFATDGELEGFIATLGHGARWKVLSAFAVVAASGVGMAILAERPWPARWSVLLCIKVAMFPLALALFAHVSWRLWPRRLFASPAELPALRRTFRNVAATMIGLVGLSAALGILMHAWR